MFAWIHSEDVADELPSPPEDLLTDGADVSPVSNLILRITAMKFRLCGGAVIASSIL